MSRQLGFRVYNKQPHELLAGEFGQHDGGWYCIPPGTDLLANLGKHTVTEHEDGTITVNPSIEVSNGIGGYWHGWLERGIWRDV